MCSYFIRFVVGAALIGCVAQGQTPPVNDNFANRTMLQGADIIFAGSALNATYEPNDPALGRGLVEINGGSSSSHVTGSVWWSWTPSFSGYALLSLPPSAGLTPNMISTFLVFSGDVLTNLSYANRVTHLDVTSGQACTFRFAAGQSYSFEFVSHAESNLNVSFKLSAAPTPVILEQPQSQAVRTGGAAYFTVLAPDYATNGNTQWQHNGVNIPGANGPTFQVNNASQADAGEYRALVNTADPSAMTISAPATLTVEGVDAPPTIQLSYVRGTTNEFLIQVVGEAEHFYTVHHSTNFAFGVSLLFPNLYDQGPAQPYLAHGRATPFNARDGDVSFLRATRAGDLKQTCIANLRRLEFAKNAWMIWRRTGYGAAIHQGEISSLFLDERSLVCPQGGALTYNAVGANATCDVVFHAQ